ncbi:zinc ribbon domain-containing protein [Caldicellulosiruptoraceae bacterium PP1]
MFFIGIFGVENKSKKIKNINLNVCPFCSREANYELFEDFSYFHIFFIPVFKWGTKYILKTNCCNRIYALNPDVAKRIKNNEDAYINLSDVQLIGEYETSQIEFCPNCKNKVSKTFLYCPYCGTRL